VESESQPAEREAVEIGRHYRFNGATPVETPVLAIGATGEARPQGLYDAARDYSFADFEGRSGCDWRNERGIGWQDGGPDWLTRRSAERFI